MGILNLRYSKVPEYISVSVGHELANSFLVLRLDSFFLHMIINVSFRQRLHFLLMLL